MYPKLNKEKTSKCPKCGWDLHIGGDKTGIKFGCNNINCEDYLYKSKSRYEILKEGEAE